MAHYELEETKLILRRVWAFMLMALYGIGLFHERSIVLKTAAEEQIESVLPSAAKVIFFGLVFVSFLIDIVEMREDRNKAYQFLFLSLVVGGISAVVSAAQYNILVNIFG